MSALQYTFQAAWEQKAWGETSPVMVTTAFEVHRLRVVAGGFSSIHRHRKYNFFAVTAGEVVVQHYGDGLAPTGEPTQTYHLDQGIRHLVPPGRWHKFQAKQACELVEVYWMGDVEPTDIERFNVGGLSL